MNAPELPLEISCQDVQRKRAAGDDFLLLDCREQNEYDLVRIEGARLLPMSQLVDRAEELESHRERPIAVYCHHGGRSLQVTAWLRNQGFPQAQSMRGGIDVWALEIDSSLPRY
jgi:rhodanese-related sulfurtransferase